MSSATIPVLNAANSPTGEFRRLIVAGHLIEDALENLRDHEFNCPRSRDDFDCTCGLSDLKERMREWLKTA